MTMQDNKLPDEAEQELTEEQLKMLFTSAFVADKDGDFLSAVFEENKPIDDALLKAGAITRYDADHKSDITA